MKSIAQENYQKTIFELQEVERVQIVTIGRLASALKLTPGTVTGMVKKLAANDLLDYKTYTRCSLTDKGRKQAVEIVRRHRILELFLAQTIGLPMAGGGAIPSSMSLEDIIAEREMAVKGEATKPAEKGKKTAAK